MGASVGLYANAKSVERPTWERIERFGVGHEIYRDRRINPKQWLYRYMSAERAFKTIGERKFWFADPKEWDDPHEAWWCKQLFTEHGHLPGNRAFGLCWTLRWRDEANWRLYSCPSNDALPAVRIRVRARDLTTWLHATVRDYETVAKGFLGVVSYCSIGHLIRAARELHASGKKVARVGAETLLMKRIAYEFEHEVRALWLDSAKLGAPKGLACSFDPNTLVDQVMIGPSKDANAIARVERKLRALSLAPTLITKSKIWDPPSVQADAEREAARENALSGGG